MNKQLLKKIIKEELRKVMSEANIHPASNLLSLLAAPEFKKEMSNLADLIEPNEFRLIEDLYTKLNEALKKYE